MEKWIDPFVFVVVASIVAWLVKRARAPQESAAPEIAGKSRKLDRVLDGARTAAWIVFLGGVAGLVLLSTRLDRFPGVLPWVLGTLLFAFLTIVILGVLQAWVRAATLPFTPESSVMTVVITALTWGMIDAFFFGQGSSVILCMAGVFYFLPRALTAAARRDGARFKLRLSKAAITTAAGFAALGTVVYGNVIARERAERLVVAVEQFHVKNGGYPERLEELVPVFMPEIPRAKYVMIADKFRYSASGSQHSLMYVVLPPFGRSIYTFEDRAWTTLD